MGVLHFIFTWLRRLWAFLLFFYVATSMAHAAALATDDGAPAGFEFLDQPRPTIVALYYGGDALGSFPAHFSATTLSFDHPADVVKAVPNIKDAAKMIAALSLPIPANAKLLCSAKKTTDCGVLNPDTVGVIFDENQLTAELFIAQSELSVADENASRYLPLPARDLASVLGFSGAVNGNDTTGTNYSLTNNAVYSYGEGKLTTQSTIANDGMRFDTAAASIDRRGWNGTVGLFRSRPMELIGDHDIAGVSLSTSQRTHLDAYKAQGNDIVLYLPRRAYVSIYREGRLYSSRIYEAGNQLIDTSELPEGAYNITLRTQEAGGQTHEEQRFYAKNENIPPQGEATYYIEGGVLRAAADRDALLPKLTGAPVLRTGTVQRLDDNIAADISVLGLSDRALTEAGIYWLVKNAEAKATIMASSAGNYGIQASYIQSLDRFSAAFDARRLWGSDDALNGYDELTQSIMQTVATVSYAVTDSMTLGLRANYTAQDGAPTNSSLGPYMVWNIWQRGESVLSLNADVARTGDSSQGSLMMHFSQRLGDYGFTGAMGGSAGKDSGGPTGAARIWHDDQKNNNDLQLGGGISGDRRATYAEGDAIWNNDWGHLSGSLQQGLTGGNTPLSYSGNMAINAAEVGDEIYVGGDQNNYSAVVINVDGDVNIPMKIYVNGSTRNTVKVGNSRVVYLAPFHTYNIRLAPAVGGLLDYDNTDRKVTLYPGNVQKLQWSVNKVYAVVARIVMPDGAPLVHADLQGARVATMTNDGGYIQTEMANPQGLTFIDGNNAQCEVQLPPQEPVNGILLYKTPLLCKPAVS